MLSQVLLTATFAAGDFNTAPTLTVIMLARTTQRHLGVGLPSQYDSHVPPLGELTGRYMAAAQTLSFVDADYLPPFESLPRSSAGPTVVAAGTVLSAAAGAQLLQYASGGGAVIWLATSYATLMERAADFIFAATGVYLNPDTGAVNVSLQGTFRVTLLASPNSTTCVQMLDNGGVQGMMAALAVRLVRRGHAAAGGADGARGGCRRRRRRGWCCRHSAGRPASSWRGNRLPARRGRERAARAARAGAGGVSPRWLQAGCVALVAGGVCQSLDLRVEPCTFGSVVKMYSYSTVNRVGGDTGFF